MSSFGLNGSKAECIKVSSKSKTSVFLLSNLLGNKFPLIKLFKLLKFEFFMFFVYLPNVAPFSLFLESYNLSELFVLLVGFNELSSKFK